MAVKTNSARRQPHTKVTDSASTTDDDLVSTTTRRKRLVIGIAVILLSSLPLLSQIRAFPEGDMLVYHRAAEAVAAGKMPYRDFVFEYPPYSIAIFLLPQLLSPSDYTKAFISLTFLGDFMLKALLLAGGLGRLSKSKWLLPLLCYCLSVLSISNIYLQRFDVWPALFCLLAIILFCSKRYALSGLAIAIGMGVKVYPAVLLPTLWMLSVRQGKGKRFTAGVIAGLLPLLVISFAVPWWRFAAFQGARGLQVESLYASLLWLTKRLGFAQLQWVHVKKWYEVSGPLATALMPWARSLFIAATGGTVFLAMWFAAKTRESSSARLARLLLVPLVGFVVFSQVLSPQFMVWLLPFAVLSCLDGSFWTAILVVAATMLTPGIYPVAEYFAGGLNLYQTILLVLRNLLLLAALLVLVCEQWNSLKLSRG